MTRSVGLLILLCPIAARAESPDVAALVEQLGDPKFAVRESAQRELQKRGEDIVPELDRLAKTADAEIAERLRKVRYALVGYRDDIRRMLDGGESWNEPSAPVSNELISIVTAHQPKSTEYLLSLFLGRDSLAARRARMTFVATWDSATVDQLRRYLNHVIAFKMPHRSAYPAKVDAVIAVDAVLTDSGSGWLKNPRGRSPFFNFKASLIVDGKADGQEQSTTFEPPLMAATIGAIRTREMQLGEHTIQAVGHYEFARRGLVERGVVRSQVSRFRIVPADTPDDLAAPASVRNEVTKAFEIAETGTPMIVPTDSSDVSKLFRADPWYPQSTWRVEGDRWASIHSPVWVLRKKPPVDFCFDVEFHDVQTGKVHPGYSFTVLRDTNIHEGAINLKDPGAFAGDREGFVKVKVVLKPSRALALSDMRVSKYYAETISSSELRVRIYPAPRAK